MTRTTLLALGLVAFGPAAASAQQAFTSGLVVLHDGKEATNGAKAFGTVADCEDDVVWTFRTNYSQRVSVVEAWLGVGTIDCSTISNRQKATTTATQAPCKFLGLQNGVANASIDVTSRELFTGVGEDPGEPPVSVTTANDTGTSTDGDGGTTSDDAGSDGGTVVEDAGTTTTTTGDPLYNGCYRTRGTPTKTLYLLALDQQTNLTTNTATAPLGIPKGVLKATFTPYTDRPDAPTSVTGRSGQSEIGVHYSVDTANQAPQTAYKAYFDYGQTGGTIGCGSGLLEADADGITHLPASGTANVVSSKKTSGSSATISNLDALGILVGESVAASAVTIDPAGNESLPSEPICIQRVQTSSFVDSCEANPKCKSGLSTCSLYPVPARDLFAGLSLTGLALAFVLRRRRKT